MPAANPDVASVERIIPSPPGPIFDLLADPAKHRLIDGSGTVRGTTGPTQRLQLGSRFGMHMKLGVPYSMESKVIEFEEDRRIAWQPRPTLPFLRPFIGGRIWRYELEPAEGGTLVRETWDITHEKVKQAVRPMRAKTIESMTATLARIEEIVTSGSVA